MSYAALAAALPLFFAILWQSDGAIVYLLILILLFLPLVLLTLLLFRVFPLVPFANQTVGGRVHVGRLLRPIVVDVEAFFGYTH
jgi:hypothetical protein